MAPYAAKKRRPGDEVEEEMHLAFRDTANALSQVYTQAVAHQKASFLAGERRAMENVYRWLSSQREQVSEVPVSDVLAYLQDNPFSFGSVAVALNAPIGYDLINSFPNGKGAQNDHSIQSQDFMHCNSYDPSMEMRHDDP